MHRIMNTCIASSQVLPAPQELPKQSFLSNNPLFLSESCQPGTFTIPACKFTVPACCSLFCFSWELWPQELLTFTCLGTHVELYPGEDLHAPVAGS